MKSKIALILLVTILPSVSGSECGESTIPYSLEVLPSGQPILGCARPTCFGWNPNGHQLLTTAKFFRIDQQSDGFLRDDPLAIHTFDAADPRVYAQQKATCEREFQSLSCASEDQWVGGIAPVMNATATTIVAYQCCTYPPLRASIDRGVATVAGGQIVIGGEVKENEKQYAFDYISNIEKKFDEEGEVYYEVNIRRLSCLDLQDVDRSVAEVINAENTIRHVNGQNAAAHQVRVVAVENPVVPGTLRAAGILRSLEPQAAEAAGPEAPAVQTQDVIVEEIVAQPGFVHSETAIAPPPEPQPQPPVVEGFQQGPIPQPNFQPNGIQVQPPQGFQPAPVQQPVNFAAGGQPGYGYMPLGFQSPTALQLYYCFPADSQVMISDGSTKRMDEVEVGDWVATFEDNGLSIQYVPVQYWLHRDENQEAEFIEFDLDNGEKFSLTEKHMVFVTNCPPEREAYQYVDSNPVAAEKVNIGDCFYIAYRRKEKQYQRVKVIDINYVKKTGIYAPMTSRGNLLVNKIYSSCHSETDNHVLQNTFWKTMFRFKKHIAGYFTERNNNDGSIGLGAHAVLAVLDLIIPEKILF